MPGLSGALCSGAIIVINTNTLFVFLAIGDAAMDPIDFPIAPRDAMKKVHFPHWFLSLYPG